MLSSQAHFLRGQQLEKGINWMPANTHPTRRFAVRNPEQLGTQCLSSIEFRLRQNSSASELP